ncbi:MAG TPA: hypothetical protein VNM67_19490 [Thermoanaerobaculia bacterium]|nr:hypothetical protein [Thermoanaerobaculia bacterium]
MQPRYTGWLRLLLRAVLALPMIGSGISRLIPVQMPPPFPFDFLRRLGELTPMELLWTFIGASPTFQSFTGLAGLAGGLLLLFPRTALLGALICAANLLMAVTLSLCYDLPFTPYLSFLLLLAVLLIAPDLRRLANLFLLDRAVEPAEEPVTARSPQLVMLLLALCVIVWTSISAGLRFKELYPPKPPFYGAWSVEEFAVNGEEVPMFTDPDRWQRVAIQEPGALDVELMIGSRKRFPKAAFSFAQPEPDVLILEGRRMRAKLRRMPLSSSWFHWILDMDEE